MPAFTPNFTKIFGLVTEKNGIFFPKLFWPYCEFEAEGQTFLRSLNQLMYSNSEKFETEHLFKLFTGGFLSQEIVFEFAVEFKP